MKYHWVTVAALLAALILYASGMTTSTAGTSLGAFLISVGCICELTFWTRLGRARRAK
jgi:hypothetical protein